MRLIRAIIVSGNQTISHFIQNKLHLSLRNDPICVFFHQDCIRNIHPYELSRMKRYGITVEDCQSTKIYSFYIWVCVLFALFFIILFSLSFYRTLFHPVFLLLLLASPLYYNYGFFYGTIALLLLITLLSVRNAITIRKQYI